ncbi:MULTISPECIES: hypothetical protein [Phenylobacterium]|uniref:Uncharacterized protein n=1 Tax=Phenylobacterium koreense TaxID=266125 RepID=A0ABV2EGY2_9CAUL
MADQFDDVLGGDEGQKPKGRTPPYIAYKTFLNLLSELKAHGLPPQIDRSVLTRFAGGLQGQILLALRSLDLIDDAKRPTPKLAALVDTYDTPTFKSELRPIVEATYPAVLRLDLLTATPSMFADAFKVGTDAKEDVLRKCRTFFLHAARDVGIPLGPRIEKAKFPRPRNGGAPRRSKAPAAEPQKVTDVGGVGGGTPPPNPMSDKALEYKLVDLMKEDDIDDAERSAIWTLIQYLTRKSKNKAANQ